MVYILDIKNSVNKALLYQSIKKVPRPNIYNLQIFYILWD